MKRSSHSNRRKLICRTAAACLFIVTTAAGAQSYPDKPIRVIVPFTAGGGSDVIARLLGPRLSERLGKPMVIDNRAAASGVVGTDVAAKSAPDGYTLLMITSTHAVNAGLATRLPYDLIKDFAAISMVTSSPFGLMLQPSVSALSTREFIDYARANPGKLNFGSSGPGSSPHLATELFMSMSGITMTHVPYKGVAQYVAAQVGGEIQFSFGNMFSTMGHWKSGRLRLIAHGGSKRLEAFPDLPAVAETVPGFEAAIWYGYVAPARTPPAVISRLNADIVAVLRMPEVNKRLVALGADVVPNSSEEFGRFVRDEIQKWAKVVKASGAKAE